MHWRDLFRPKSILIDAAVIGAIVTGANLLFDRNNAGWTNLSPSPYLLLPLLLGGRYGFTAGLLAGAAASVIVLVQQRFLGSYYSFNHALSDSVYLHAAFLFVGGLTGELFNWFRRERAQTEAQLEKLQTSVRQLDTDVNYLRGVKDELDRVVAARDGEVSALDTELRRLYATGAAELPAAVLQFLRRQVRLTDAALYSVPPGGGPLPRLALLGREANLPATLQPKAGALVALTLQRGSLVVLPELLQQRDAPADEAVLLAAPLLDATGQTRAVLVVTGMPFISFTAHTANLIELVCKWAGEVLDLAQNATGRYRIVAGRENQRLFTRAYFEHLLQLALITYQRHRLPSSVVLFSLPGAPASERARFEQALLHTVRAGDYAAELNRPEPHLAILLPLVGERGASIFIERSRQYLKKSGPWPVEIAVQRVEFGHAENVAALLAEIDAAFPPGSSPR